VHIKNTTCFTRFPLTTRKHITAHMVTTGGKDEIATNGNTTMTTERSENSAITMPCMNVTGYIRHAVIFACACCLVAWLWLGLDVLLGWLAVMHTHMYMLPFSQKGTNNKLMRDDANILLHFAGGLQLN